MLGVCDGASSCCSVNGFCLKGFLLSARVEVNIVSICELVLTLAPCGTKMRGDFHVLETAAHTMTEDGFWRLKTFRMESGMSTEDLARIRSFCRLNTSSKLNTFSSEKIISPVSVNDFILFRRIFARASLRRWQVCSLTGENLRLVLTIFLIVFSLTSISQVIFFIDLLELRRILARTALMTFGVQETRGLLLQGRSSVLVF